METKTHEPAVSSYASYELCKLLSEAGIGSDMYVDRYYVHDLKYNIFLDTLAKAIRKNEGTPIYKALSANNLFYLLRQALPAKSEKYFEFRIYHDRAYFPELDIRNDRIEDTLASTLLALEKGEAE